LRAEIEAVVDERISEASVDITLHTINGRVLHHFVAHAVGRIESPVSNEHLRPKFMGQSEPVLGAGKAQRAWALSMDIGSHASLREFIATAT